MFLINVNTFNKNYVNVAGNGKKAEEDFARRLVATILSEKAGFEFLPISA
jgi:hypothetical protein